MEDTIFGPSQTGNPLTDFDKIWNRWLGLSSLASIVYIFSLKIFYYHQCQGHVIHSNEHFCTRYWDNYCNYGRVFRVSKFKYAIWIFKGAIGLPWQPKLGKSTPELTDFCSVQYMTSRNSLAFKSWIIGFSGSANLNNYTTWMFSGAKRVAMATKFRQYEPELHYCSPTQDNKKLLLHCW